MADGSAWPGWLTFNASTREFAGTPPSNFNGFVDIEVTASDGSLTTSDVFRLTVTPVNDAPTAIALSVTSIAENSAIGTVIGTLSATDADAGDTATYSLVTGTGSADNGLVSIVGNQLRVNGSIDFETNPTLDLRVRVTDGGGLSFERAVTVAVTDIVEGPVLNVINGTNGNNNQVNGGGILGILFPDAFRGLLGTAGADQINALGGNDYAYGFGGNDTIEGGTGDDYLYGDFATGLAGLVQQLLHPGAEGNDRLNGGAGSDHLFGAGGNDWLNGGSGRDYLNGGAGADQFVFDDGDSGVAANQRDRIEDFRRSQGDHIDLRLVDGNAATSADDGLALRATQAQALNQIGSVYLGSYANGQQTVFINSSAAAGFEMAIDVATNSALVAADFFLV